MKAAFIRHKLDFPNGEKTLKKMWDDRIVAVDYDYKPNNAQNDSVKTGRNALDRLIEFCHEGGVIGADYNLLYPSKMLVGEIPKGTSMVKRKYDDYEYQTFQLVNVREVSFSKYPALSAMRPKMTTFSKWPMAEKYLNSIIKNEPLSREVRSLSDSFLEVLCHEYMREAGLIDTLLMPIGRTLKDLDIIGLGSKGEYVAAQVTFEPDDPDVDAKCKSLMSYNDEPESKLYFFGPPLVNKKLPEPIIHIDIEMVFQQISSSSKSAYKRLINLMIYGE